MQEIKKISSYKEGLRGKILATAMKAFTEEGIRAVKMDDIAARLGISKRTLYEIYENKEVLLYEGVRQRREESMRQMEEATRGSKNVMEILLKAYRQKVLEFQLTSQAFYVDLVKYPRILRYLNRENMRVRADMVKFMERGVYEGYFREGINFELAARLFDALGRYVMAQQLYKQYTIEQIFENLVFVTLRGFCTEKGVKALDRLI